MLLDKLHWRPSNAFMTSTIQNAPSRPTQPSSCARISSFQTTYTKLQGWPTTIPADLRGWRQLATTQIQTTIHRHNIGIPLDVGYHYCRNRPTLLKPLPHPRHSHYIKSVPSLIPSRVPLWNIATSLRAHGIKKYRQDNLVAWHKEFETRKEPAPFSISPTYIELFYYSFI